jgi:hypothetical protein
MTARRSSERRVRIIVRVERYPEKGGPKQGESSWAYHSIPEAGVSLLAAAFERVLAQLGGRRMWCRRDDDVWTYMPVQGSDQVRRQALRGAKPAPEQLELGAPQKKGKRARRRVD